MTNKDYKYLTSMSRDNLDDHARKIGVKFPGLFKKEELVKRILQTVQKGEEDKAKKVVDRKTSDLSNASDNKYKRNIDERNEYKAVYDKLLVLPLHKIEELSERSDIDKVKGVSKKVLIQQIIRKNSLDRAYANAKSEAGGGKTYLLRDNELYRLALGSFMLSQVDDVGLSRVIDNINSHLVALRTKVGHVEYCRSLAVQLTGETIVAFQMASKLRRQTQLHHMGADALRPPQAECKMRAFRRDLYKSYECTFRPYFEGEPRVANLDLTLLRRSSMKAAEGDNAAMLDIEYIFTFHHAVLGIYYGWQKLTLAGKSATEAAAAFTATMDSDFNSSTLSTLLSCFALFLNNENADPSGRFDALYTRPSH